MHLNTRYIWLESKETERLYSSIYTDHVVDSLIDVPGYKYGERCDDGHDARGGKDLPPHGERSRRRRRSGCRKQPPRINTYTLFKWNNNMAASVDSIQAKAQHSHRWDPNRGRGDKRKELSQSRRVASDRSFLCSLIRGPKSRLRTNNKFYSFHKVPVFQENEHICCQLTYFL